MSYLTKIFNINIVKISVVFLLVFSIGLGGPIYVYAQTTYTINGKTYTEEDLDNGADLNLSDFDYETLQELRGRNTTNNTSSNTNSFLRLQTDPTLNNPDFDENNPSLNLRDTVVESPNTSNSLYSGDYTTQSQASSQDLNYYDRAVSRDNISGTVDGRRGINSLYPAKGTPNEVNLESLGVDAASCLGALMATILVRNAINLISDLGEGAEDSSWMGKFYAFIFGGGANVSGRATVKVTGNGDIEAKEVSRELFGIPFFPNDDGIAFCAKNILIAYIQATIIEWANTAFNDAAVFVEDLESTLNEVANIAYRKAIGEVTICANVRANVELSALANLLRSERAPQQKGCTVSFDRNYYAIMEGRAFNYYDFYKITNDPAASAIGANLAVADRFHTLRNQYERNLLEELGWSNGFWPWKDQYGRTLTPGQVVENKIHKLINLSTDNLVIADEVDEIIFTIFNQLIKVNLSDSLSI